MQAVRIHEFGGRDVLAVEEVPDPEPGAGQVRIKVEVCALNHVDVDIREGISRFDLALPHILGLEPVGRVDRLGPGVDELAVGDRVMPYLLGGDRFIGVGGPGGFADYVARADQAARPRARSDPDEQAGALQVAFGTAWHMLFGRGGLRIGETRPDQLGVERHRLGGGPAGPARRRVRDRHLELAREARAGPERTAWTSGSTTPRRTSRPG